MDDFYFSGNKRNTDNAKNNNSVPSQDKFINTDYYDESFNLNFKSKGNAQSFSKGNGKKGNFQVNIPETEYEISEPVYQRDRTPKGRAVGRTDYGAPSQNNHNIYGGSQVKPRQNIYDGSQNVYHNPYQQQRQPQHANSMHHRNDYSAVNHGSRVPQGNRVAGPASGNRRAPSGDSNRNKGSKNQKPPVKKSSSKGLIIAGFFSLVLIAIVALGAFAFSAINSLEYDDSIVANQYINENELYSSPSVKNILFIGSDARGDVEGQRSDTMILFSIDQKNGQIKLTSFLRDSYVYIPSKGYKTKLNAAFSSGGTQLVLDTIEYNFGVNIDNYIMVDFVAFQQLIDLMGGVTIEGVTEKEARYMNNEVKIPSVKEGTNKMNGFTALWYCRIRKLDSDFYRTQRQRKVISSVLAQAKKTNPFTLASICKQVLPNISTDIDRGEMLSLAVGAVFRFLSYDIVQQQIPADGTWSNERINGSAVIAMDIDENKEILINFLSTKYVEPEEVTEE